MRIASSTGPQTRLRAVSPLFVALAALALAGCSPESPELPTDGIDDATDVPSRIEGSVLYRERIALPPDATLRVQLVDRLIADGDDAVLAETELAAMAPPIRFALDYDPDGLRANGEYGLLASIRGRGPGGEDTLLFASDTALPWQPGAPDPQIVLTRATPAANAGDDTGEPVVYQCGQARVEAQYREAAVTLTLPDTRLSLPQAVAASGARYEIPGTQWWTKGSEATLERNGVRTDCAEVDASSPWTEARERGVGYRAIGQEPGWIVEVYRGEKPRLTAQLDYGTRTLSYASAEPFTEPGGTVGFRAGEGVDALELRIAREPCSDVMNGEAFDTRATLVTAGATFAGCGRYLDLSR